MSFKRPLAVCIHLALDFVLPVALLIRLFTFTPISILDWICTVGNDLLAIILLFAVAYWEYVNYYLRYVYLLGAFVGVLNSLPDLSGLPFFTGRFTPVRIFDYLLFMLLVYFLVGVLRDAKIPHTAVDLDFPMAEGKYLITEGGDGKRSFFLNYHYRLGQHRLSEANAALRFAIDIVKLDELGFTCRGFLPQTAAAYHVYAEPVYCPLEGIVYATGDHLADNRPYQGQYPYNVGNYIVIKTGFYYVLLCHLKPGSLRVAAGDRVKRGQQLAMVGNSGYSPRPHLHIQINRAEDGQFWEEGESTALLFGGRQPIKNRVFDVLR